MNVRLLSIITLSALPVFIAKQPVGLSETLRTTAIQVTEPVMKIAHDTSDKTYQFIESIKGMMSAHEENESLKQEVSRLEVEIANLKQEGRENERLRSLLSLKKTYEGHLIPAQVIARDITHWREWLAIDKGTQNNVKKDMAVMSETGLIGRILSAGAYSSRVMLITDPQSRVSIRIRETRDAGLLEGDGSTNLTLKYMDVHADLKPGQVIETSGLGGIYPKGLLVGRVIKVWIEKNGLYQGALVEPYADFSKLEDVVCVVPPQTE